MITNDAASPIQSAPLDLEAITTHLIALAGTQRCPRCDTAVISAIADITGPLAILVRLCEELASARLGNANLRAAMQAALGAAADGEPDPLDYLRWELSEPPPDAGRGRP